MHIDPTPKYDFDDVLIRPKRSSLGSRADVELVRTFKVLPHAKQGISGVPVIAANMDSVGTTDMAKALSPSGMFTALHKHYRADELKAADIPGAHSFVTFGIGAQAHVDDMLAALPQVDKICLDVANGYTEAFVRFVSQVRERHPDKIIMAGNVVTPDMTEALIIAGADIVKVGIGPGSACTTRRMTGVGYPQLSAIIECADAAHGLKGLICADGGCREPGDIAKAFAAGADFVMLGGMLAGHTECLSRAQLEKVRGGEEKVEYYGMSSAAAMNKYAGGVAAYRAPEGRVVEVGYKGGVKETVQEILGGLRSACTYVGAAQLKELSKRTTFVVRYGHGK